MGKDKHFSVQATEIAHLETKHIFHIVDDDSPLLEEGIIGLSYLQRYDRYSVTEEYLFLDKVKLPLHDDGGYMCQNTVQVRKIDVPIEEGEVWIKNQNIIRVVSLNRYQYQNSMR